MTRADDATLRITEVFTSLQGEALSQGFPTVFIRLTGCPLRCGYCDSAYAFHGGSQLVISSLLDQVSRTGVTRVCVTGGEPLAQPNCHLLLTALCDAGYDVSLETSGAIDIEPVDPRVSIVLDVKTPGSGEAHRNRIENYPLLKHKDQVKAVITNNDDLAWFELFCDQHSDLLNAGTIWVSPSYGEMDLEVMARWVIAQKGRFRFQLQLHKHIWGEEAGH
ncbi:MAG: radical SAM protein [Gammaproteobacteria bacterium]|nr:radical SAM protein [Gammaproteobacteria bacterium]